jgi:hypothetical protein
VSHLHWQRGLVVARMYARVLSGAHEITIATDGISAAELVASQDFDVARVEPSAPRSHTCAREAVLLEGAGPVASRTVARCGYPFLGSSSSGSNFLFHLSLDGSPAGSGAQVGVGWDTIPGGYRAGGGEVQGSKTDP